MITYGKTFKAILVKLSVARPHLVVLLSENLSINNNAVIKAQMQMKLETKTLLGHDTLFYFSIEMEQLFLV